MVGEVGGGRVGNGREDGFGVGEVGRIDRSVGDVGRIRDEEGSGRCWDRFGRVGDGEGERLFVVGRGGREGSVDPFRRDWRSGFRESLRG